MTSNYINPILGRQIANSGRPSKNFMYRFIYNKIRQTSLSGKVVGDLACNDCRNIKFFEKNEISYWGFDYDKNILKGAIEKSPDLNCVSCNLLTDELPSSIFDLVICTETIEHFGNQENKLKGVKNILTTLRSNAKFMINVHGHEENEMIGALLSKKFKKIEKLPYRNFISQRYERLFEVEGHISIPKTNFKLILHFVINWFLVCIEYLASYFKIKQSACVYFCDGHIGDYENQNIENFVISTGFNSPHELR